MHRTIPALAAALFVEIATQVVHDILTDIVLRQAVADPGHPV